MRSRLVALVLCLAPAAPALAQISIEIGVPVSIGVEVSAYPELVQVPGYPVYYDPRASSNYFFYDGLYWVYLDDRWYSSDWYDGPWQMIGPEYVPLFVLRIPVQYYRQPPAYFRGWQRDAPPRWGDHWGRGWEERRSGWERWDRRAPPPPAPLPAYQRQYSGDRYPRVAERQQALRVEHYRYEPREPVAARPARPPNSGGRPEQAPQAPARGGHPAPPAEHAAAPAPAARGAEHQARPPAPDAHATAPPAAPDQEHADRSEAKAPPAQSKKAPAHEQGRDDEHDGEHHADRR